MSQDPVALALGDWNSIKSKTNGDIKTYLSNPQKHNSYSYAFNNPVKYQDDGGEWAGIDDLAATGAGFVGGIAAQGVSDVIGGKLSSFNSYIASGVGGAVTAETALYMVPTTGLAGLGMAGVAGGFAEYSVETTLKGNEYNIGDATMKAFEQGASTVLLGGIIKIPNVKISGINIGKGSFQAVSNQITTKLNNGTIENVSAGTFGKMFVNEFVSESSNNTAEGVIDGVSRSMKKTQTNTNKKKKKSSSK